MSDSQEGVRIEDGPKRIRTYLGGEPIADTRRPKLVWEIPYYPAYYFPREDVRMELLAPNGHTRHSESRGDAQSFTVKGGTREAEDAASHYPESPVEQLRAKGRWVRGGRGGFRPPPRPVQARRRPAQLAPRADRAERSRRRRHLPPDAPVRDGTAHPLLRPQAGRAPRSADAHGHDERL